MAEEFKKANVLPGAMMQGNYETHPRQLLREASRLFAPLGNDVVFAATGAAMYVERYFEAVKAYNDDFRGSEGARLWDEVQLMRKAAGDNLDITSMRIPKELRWTYGDGSDYKFTRLCTMPSGFAKQIGYDKETGEIDRGT